MGRQQHLQYMFDLNTGMWWSRRDRELLVPVYQFADAKPENNFAMGVKLEKMPLDPISGREWNSLVRTKKCPLNIKNVHRQHWGMKPLPWRPGEVLIFAEHNPVLIDEEADKLARRAPAPLTRTDVRKICKHYGLRPGAVHFYAARLLDEPGHIFRGWTLHAFHRIYPPTQKRFRKLTIVPDPGKEKV